MLGSGNGEHLLADIVHVDAVPRLREDAALLDVGGVADDHAVVVADDVADHVVLLRQHLVVEHLGDLFAVVLGLDAQHDHVAGDGVLAHGGGVLDEALPSRLAAGEDDQRGRALAEVVFLLQLFEVENLHVGLAIRRQRHVRHANLNEIRDGRAGLVHVVEVASVHLLHHALGEVGAQRGKALVGQRVQLLVELLIHRHRLLLTLLELSHVEVGAIGVLHPVLLQKGVMDADPDHAAFDGDLADGQVVAAVAGAVVLEQIRHLVPVVGMDGGVAVAALIADTLLLRALHHLCVLPRAPDRTIAPVRLHAHQYRVVVQRLEQLFVKFCLELKHAQPRFERSIKSLSD